MKFVRNVAMSVFLMVQVFIGAKYMSKQSWAAAFAFGQGCLYLALKQEERK